MLIPGANTPYCYDFLGYGKACMPTIETFFQIPPPVTSGVAVYYNSGAMEATAQYRGYPLNPEEAGYVGYVATETPAMIGWSVWIQRSYGWLPNSGPWEGPFLVVDCPRRNYQYGQVVLWGQVVEVDFKTAQRWGMVQVTGLNDKRYYTYKVLKASIPDVQVSYYNPNFYMPPAVSYKEWYLSMFISGHVTETPFWQMDHGKIPEWCFYHSGDGSCEGKWHSYPQPEPLLPIWDFYYKMRF
jgi:hypothetical protein